MYSGSPKLDRNSPWIQADNPQKGLAIRQALSLAIDRELIRDKVLAGAGEVNFGPLLQYNNNPNTMDPSWTLPAFDKEAAKKKLAEGGYPNGFPITLFEYEDDVDTVGIAQAIAGMWRDIGSRRHRTGFRRRCARRPVERHRHHRPRVRQAAGQRSANGGAVELPVARATTTTRCSLPRSTRATRRSAPRSTRTSGHRTSAT